MTRIAKVGAGIAMLGVLIAFVATGTSLIPPSLLLSPCLKDFTSPLSYRARVSPLATVRVPVGQGTVQLCYGRPQMRGRQVFGGLVPFDTLWRIGANEPTRLSTTGVINLGSLRLLPGRYSLYSLPRPDHWTVYFTRSTRHWGNAISPAVRAEEVGSIEVPVEQLTAPVETLTIQSDGAGLAISWETTRIHLPLTPSP